VTQIYKNNHCFLLDTTRGIHPRQSACASRPSEASRQSTEAAMATPNLQARVAGGYGEGTGDGGDALTG